MQIGTLEWARLQKWRWGCTRSPCILLTCTSTLHNRFNRKILPSKPTSHIIQVWKGSLHTSLFNESTMILLFYLLYKLFRTKQMVCKGIQCYRFRIYYVLFMIDTILSMKRSELLNLSACSHALLDSFSWFLDTSTKWHRLWIRCFWVL